MSKQILFVSALTLNLALACSQAPIIPVRAEKVVTSDPAQATASFSDADVNDMVTAAETAANQTPSTPENDPAIESEIAEDLSALVDQDVLNDVESNFAEIEQNQADLAKAKKVKNVKGILKNLIASAKLGDKKKVLKIAKAMLKEVDKNANGQQQADQVQAKANKSKFSILMKKVIKAANKNKKDDLKQALKDLVTLLK